MAPPPELSLNGWSVLALLVDEGPAHGFDLSRRLAKGSEVGQVWSVSRPLVYRALDQLATAGLVRADDERPGEGGPNRRPYRATAAGGRAMAAWRSRPVEHLRDVRAELMLKLVLTERAGLDPSPLLRDQLARITPLVADLAEQAGGDVSAGGGRSSADHAVAVWRHQLALAVERTLTALLAEHDPAPRTTPG